MDDSTNWSKVFASMVIVLGIVVVYLAFTGNIANALGALTLPSAMTIRG